ncbi:MAG: hypothetical protein ACP5EP_10875, partial [Acidobacteriaceae bacterium]
NSMDDVCDRIAISEALFGDEQIVIIPQKGGKERIYNTRARNGAWFGKQGPQNTLVSAVIVTNHLSPTTLRSDTVELIHNPWAVHPLLQEALPIPQWQVSLEDNQLHRQNGKSAADILNVPQPWPVQDSD